MAASWKTSAGSICSAAASFVLFSSQLGMIAFPKWALALAMFAQVGGLVAFGISAKDYKETK